MSTEQSLKILLIDSNVQSHDVLSFALNELHIKYCCRFATNNKDAVKSLQLCMPDYILIDINAPGLNIKGLIKQLKKIYGKVKPTNVIYSERLDTALCKRALKLGIAQALQKSNEIFVVMTQIKKMLCFKH